MSQVLQASIIVVITIIMFFHPKVSNAAAATTGAILMSIVGLLDYKTMFNYYTSTSIILIVGMMIIGGGMFHTGFAGWLGNSIVKLTGNSERSIQLVAILSGLAISAIASGSASMMILFPIFSSICLSANVSMSRVMFPLFSGIGLGSFMTLAGSGMGPATSAILIDAGFQGWGFFEPTWFGLPKAVILIIVIILVGNKLLPKTFVLPDQAEVAKADAMPKTLNGKMIVSGLILVVTIIGMVINSKYLPMHMVAAIGAMVSVLTGCLNEKEMFKSISWTTVFLIGGMSAVAKGVEASGLGKVLANQIISSIGSNTSPFIMTIVLFIVTGIITQFMSNNAAAAIMAPIGIAVAKTMNIDPHAFVAAAYFGSAIGMCTPMATPTLAFFMEAGKYTPKNVLKWGLLETAVSILTAILIIPLIWL